MNDTRYKYYMSINMPSAWKPFLCPVKAAAPFKHMSKQREHRIYSQGIQLRFKSSGTLYYVDL
jgi:hypothetical protein